MAGKLTRRAIVTGGAMLGGYVAARSLATALPAAFRGGEALTLASHRWLLSVAGQPLAREYSVEQISPEFPTVGTVNPEDEEYQALRRLGFTTWRLPVDGLVERPLSLSLAELRSMPARTQITAHSCERGWTAIAQWTGVQLSRVLDLAGPKAEARYVVMHCVDGWYDSYTLDEFEALHPQTILAYGMNGVDLPVQHGAPLRLRVERQLGWKSLKYVNRVQLVDSVDEIGEGSGSFAADIGFQWYGGI